MKDKIKKRNELNLNNRKMKKKEEKKNKTHIYD